MPQEPPPRIPVPKYNPPLKHESELQGNQMYPFSALDFGTNEVRDRYEGVLAPLTLFAPYPHEDEPPDQNVILERPVTPINDEIKGAPHNFNRLAKYVRRRITPKNEVEHLSMEEQKELSAIIMGEVNGVWPEIRQQVDDPFFTPEQNAELQRRITVHIVTVCEQLFNHYLDKAQILNRRGVFSGPANMSRLKAQLALDSNKFLNILTIRRYIVNDLRKKQRDGDSDSDDEYLLTAQQENRAGHTKPLSNRAFLAASRPKSRAKKHYITTPEQAIREISTNMPGLDHQKLLSIIAEIPQPRSPSHFSDDYQQSSKQSVKAPVVKRKTSEDYFREKILLRRSESAPRLAPGEDLLEELGIQDGRRSCTSLVDGDDDLSHSGGSDDEEKKSLVKEAKPGTQEYLAEDLKKLVGRPEDKEDVDEELPALLQALTRSAKHDNKKEWIDQQLKELEEREKKRVEEESIYIRPPTHPQPATVEARLPNKFMARTSDIRVSERVCMSSITLDKHSTVYNDLIDEIDAKTVKNLDSNLFLGDEITEVYKEIMKTVPTDHLDLENDELIEPAADSVNLSAALSSSTLNRPKAERIINPRLQRSTADPPWGEEDPTLWARTPADPPLDLRGRPLVQPMTPRGEDRGLREFLGKEADRFIAEPSNTAKMKDMGEVMARSYASWLQWWKNTINSDDYNKYLSTQESDYMGVVFHFYNSDDEGDDEGDVTTAKTSKKAQKLSEEREKKKEELQTIKTEYKPGFWNCNAVLMGGLGRDPDMEEEETKVTEVKTDSQTEFTAAKTRSRTMLVTKRTGSKSFEQDSELKTKASDTGGSRLTPYTKSNVDTRITSGTRKSKTNLTSTAEMVEAADLSPQDRLERVWTQLHMPDTLKLDMAIKYSSEDYHETLPDAIEQWEIATELILEREHNLAKLENFERLASDPNRFFEKGFRGSSVARLQEAKSRSGYYKKIEAVDSRLKSVLSQIDSTFQDKVTFQGRVYADKMLWDRTEMLHWLQEERKQKAFDYETRLCEAPINQLRLNPISPQVTVT